MSHRAIAMGSPRMRRCIAIITGIGRWIHVEDVPPKRPLEDRIRLSFDCIRDVQIRVLGPRRDIDGCAVPIDAGEHAGGDPLLFLRAQLLRRPIFREPEIAHIRLGMGIAVGIMPGEAIRLRRIESTAEHVFEEFTRDVASKGRIFE